MVKDLFTTLVLDARAEEWNEWELPKLSRLQLQTLARLIGCPKSGTKETIMIRVLATRHIRLKLVKYTDEPEALAADFLKCDLKGMCKEAGLWRSGNKRQLAVCLLNWRARCRHQGQKIMDEIRAISKQKPQVTFPLQLTFENL